ncbi:DEAD/H box helicase domain protein [Methylocaldum marinum]|uniref:DEAD/H box helicase domain protein n=1 Tax=Methylocaldum marinum TaxID=1432792 RepID=A0A250KRH7_9GAMM|nr:DEAD/DEAH box helicase [Methylocaldum marinum]BBA34154.1 DEAD/H box helicase domain protein [Methylocaldum marinum]
MILERFHPAVSAWFRETFPAPSECQTQAWDAIKSGRHTLIAAPTGSGKTLAAFLAAIDDLVREGEIFGLPEQTRVLYISPLKALSNDIHKNLEAPLDGINAKLFELGSTDVAIRSQVRTGDTPALARAAMNKHPPHILVTTPESVYILLTSEGGRRLLKNVRTVIVDEIHAMVGSKRGSHLALSLERLERLVEHRLTRIGLSATQNPIEAVAEFLTGGPECRIIDTGHRRRLDLAIELPDSPLEAVLSQEAAKEIYDRMTALIEAHKTTLIFVNTRRLAERVARALSDRLGEEHVTSHHGSLSREQRLSAEHRLKTGKLKALVATASLELGIDVGDVDLVCQLGTTGSIATFLQRVGRSGHFAGGLPKGRLFPSSRDDLIECIALIDAVRRGELDRLVMPQKPVDVLAQQIVAMVAAEDWSEDELYRTVCRAFPYRELSRQAFDDIVKMLAEGFSTRRGPRGAYLHRDGIHKRLRARRGARLTAMTCGGAIPDTAEYRVILEPSGEFIGTVDEDFAIESLAGDIFQLGNASWRVLRLEGGTLRVEDARHQPPNIPFWFGEAPGRTHELSYAVSRLRREIEERLESPPNASMSGQGIDKTRIENGPSSLAPPSPSGNGSKSSFLPLEEEIEMRDCPFPTYLPDQSLNLPATRAFLENEVGISPSAALQAVNYLAAAKLTLGTLPTLDTLVFERFFDESGGMQFIIHAPYGNRVNRGWGLALRKRFCRTFNFELQAAATENAIILSLGVSQSFPLEDVTRFLNINTVRDILVQALLAAPMFTVRWRWNAVCSLALKRFQGGRKTPPYLLRMQAEDLVTSVFPDQLACFENIVGDREVPDHPLVNQTVHDCLSEAMDIDRLIEVIGGIESGTIRVVCRDLTEPSPLAAEIVNSKVYSFLDDAPLEERRTRAVAGRRWLDPSEAADLGRLDQAAIDRVRQEAWPEAADADELHDALQMLGYLRQTEAAIGWEGFFQELKRHGRVADIYLPNDRVLWLTAERLPQFRAIYPEADGPSSVRIRYAAQLPPEYLEQSWTAEDALKDILRARIDCVGPVTAAELAEALALPVGRIEYALLALQNEGCALRGSYTPGAGTEEWCERRLLARIHRYTINRLRQEIEPVPSADFMRFLFRWQHLHPESRMQGAQALAAVLAQLEGFEAAAVAWEGDVLPARIADYDPAWLDALCLSGKIVWTRLSAAKGGQGPVKSSPMALVARRHLPYWRQFAARCDAPEPSPAARHVADILQTRGALFFEELGQWAGLLPTQLENALAELVARGWVASDSFMGLRALLIPEQKKQCYRGLSFGMAEAGRWTLVQPPLLVDENPSASADQEAVEHIAGMLLKRYGVVFRALLARETIAPPWQDLLRIYRRLEARGEIRGGRFVAGHFGEQFALPEAVEVLRTVRKEKDTETLVTLSAVDPLNLVGIVTPGAKIPALPGNRVLFRGGIPTALHAGKETQFLVSVEKHREWEFKNRLRQRTIPPQLRAYLGSAS